MVNAYCCLYVRNTWRKNSVRNFERGEIQKMLLFSTILEIDKTMTRDAFIKLVIEWNQGSPHMDSVIKGIEWHGEYNVRYGDEKLWLEIVEYRNQNIIAVRYEKKEKDGAVWDTDYVMNFNSMKMAVRLDRSYLAEALTIDSKFSTPHFITLLIERGYIKDDGNLPVLRVPVMVDSNNIEMLADIINGKIRYRLPVVFISKTYYDEDPVNVRRLAGRLKGVAHVLVQQSNCTNNRLKEMCAGRNEYYGAIGIYYPNPAIGHRKYLYRSSIGIDSFLLEKVIRSVIQYSNSQMTDTLYTWQGVNNALLRDSLISQRKERLAAEQAQKAAENEAMQILDSLDEEERRIKKQALEEAQSEADKILDGFEEDMQRLQRQVEDLARSNEILQYENQGLKAKIDETESVPLLYMGNEFEFYSGEIKDLILSVLEDALVNIQPKTRRADVVRDIIRSNDYQKLSEKHAEEVKRLLKNYNGMSGRLRQSLEEYGFSITEEGKHCKVTYYADERYHTVFAKTPSDGRRSGKNNAAIVVKMAF